MSKTDNKITLDLILGKNTEELKATKQGSFYSEKLSGDILYTCPDDEELQAIRNDAKVPMPQSDGSTEMEVDLEKFQRLLIIKAVDKDTRSDFTFANAQLLKKLEVTTAEQVVQTLLLSGEMLRFGQKINYDMGFGERAEVDRAEAVKN